MGFFKRLKFWKRKKNNAGTKVDACVSIEDQWNCDAYTVSMDPTVMCAANTQTETTMDDGAAAAAKLQLEMKDRKIRGLEEELAFSKRQTADFMLSITSVEQEVRKYVEKPIINWSDDCECRLQVLAVADLLKKFIVTEDANQSKPEATSGRNKKTQTEGNSRQRDFAGRNSKVDSKSQTEATKKVHRQTQTKGNSRQGDFAGRNTKVDRKIQTEATSRNTTVDCQTQTNVNSRQRNCASADEEKTVRLEKENRKLSLLVEDSEREIVQLKEEMQHTFQDRTSHIHHIETRYEEENYRQLLKIRDMRDELLWYKEKLPGLTGEYILHCIKHDQQQTKYIVCSEHD